MRIIIAGSRSFNSYTFLQKEASSIISKLTQSSPAGVKAIEIVSGGAGGADKLGEQFAIENYYSIKVFPALWNTYGRKAGIIRNEQMAQYAAEDSGVLIAFWDGESRGTRRMIIFARQYYLKVFIVQY